MLSRVAVTGNRSVTTPAESPGLGGGICNNAGLPMTSSTASSNSGTQGGGIYKAGVATIYKSTITNNHSGNSGEGIDNLHTSTIVVSTLAGNSYTFAE